MKLGAKPTEAKSEIFWTTLVVSLVLLVHNGTEPLFLIALALLPLLAILFYKRPSLWPLALYLLIFGALGRYSRYFRENYASDTLPAIRDYIGYFLAGKNVYSQYIMAQNGLTPFTYLPFSLFWYLPAQVLMVDLRFFEMLMAAAVPVVFFLIGRLTGRWYFLPVLAAISLTPFLLDLSSDGSNDNSAILLLLTSIYLLNLSQQVKNQKWAIASAVILGLVISFKHYLMFYAVFFLPFLWLTKRQLSPLPNRKYLFYVGLTVAVVSLPFVLASPDGFWRSLTFIEIAHRHKTWGWNLWVALRDLLGVTLTISQMWLVRTLATAATIAGAFYFWRIDSLRKVAVAASATMMVYLFLSQWTTYAYFTFLIPLMGLVVISKV